LILSQTASHRLRHRGVGAEQVLAVLHRLDRACLQLTIGQHLDLAFEERSQVSVADYIEMIGGKTASLISAATEVGAMLADVGEEQRQAFADFGWHLGLAFQIQDDILGIWGEPDVTGKPAGDDLLARKKSLPILHGLEHSEEFRQRWRMDGIGQALVAELRGLLEQAGALDYARQTAREHTAKAVSSLEAARPSGPAAAELTELTQSLLSRHS
jgi:geranylgeranyl diphosphate synthase type I